MASALVLTIAATTAMPSISEVANGYLMMIAEPCRQMIDQCEDVYFYPEPELIEDLKCRERGRLQVNCSFRRVTSFGRERCKGTFGRHEKGWTLIRDRRRYFKPVMTCKNS